MVNQWVPVDSRQRFVAGRQASVTGQKRWVGGAWVDVTTHERSTDGQPPPPPTTPVPPGLIPNRIIAGWYSSKQSRNNTPAHAATIMDPRNTSTGTNAWWRGSTDYAQTIPGGLTRKQTPAFKEFNSGGFITNAALLSNLADADAAGYYLVQTTKVNNGDWAGVAAGTYNSTLAGYAQIARDRAAAGKRGFFMTFHHEPNGDYNGTTRTEQTWAAMQTFCSYYFAGKRGGTDASAYNGAYDTRANLSWGCIPNGFLFTGSSANQASLDRLMPASLISAFNANMGIVAVDIYDGSGAGNRLWDKVNAVAKWCNDRGVLYAGIAETGAYDAATLQAAWEAVVQYPSLFRFCIYWDSGIGPIPTGATDWRLLPNGYPADSLAGASGPFVGPGTAVTQSLLIYWRDTAVVQSEAMG